MAAALRQVRKEDRINLMRTRRATEEVFKALPSAIAVLDLDGRVEVSTETADRHFGLKPGVLAGDLGYEWLLPLIRKALDEDRIVERDPKSGYVQQFVDNREYFFQPMAVPIPVGPERREPTGVALILKDVTQVHEQQELKRGVVSTVSHQLKTPLTSLRMSIYLLLEERIGALNEKQTELLMAARDDSERLVGILDDLLDLNRIESGKSHACPRTCLAESACPGCHRAFSRGGQGQGRDDGECRFGRFARSYGGRRKDSPCVCESALERASLHQPRRLSDGSGSPEPDHVVFFVEDTGKGIPAEDLEHLFEQFYRVPGQDEKSGVGLGLAIVKEIIQAHGGDVSAESEIGKGSTFRFTLPL